MGFGAGFYLCGCNPSEKANYSNDFDPATGIVRMRRDSQGYLVCPEHGQRLYGWRSDDPTAPHYVTDPGKPPVFVSPKEVNLQLNKTEIDMRDNRDPEKVYYFEICEGRSGSNGHGV